jgi:hypothetical protein
MKPLVHTLSRPLLGAAAALALGVSALAPAAAPADPPPVQTTPATAVADTAATLTGIVGPQKNLVFYTFQYGVTSYDHSTPVSQLPAGGNGPRPVSAAVSGLTAGTLYHYRLLAGTGRFFGWVAGNDQTFTTAATPPLLPPAVAPVAGPGVAAPAPAAPVVPALGKTVVVAPLGGTVKVKAPGASGYAVLGAGGSVPVGATVDTRAGSVALTTALAGGKTQTAELHGGVFRVRQGAAAGGTTDIDLRGPALQCSTAKARASAAAAAKRKPPKRKLWAQDRGGRFRTHGHNSVATVRGTKWVTTDTCAGTRTTVTAGSVSVRDLRRKRTVLVRAGHSYLARTR